MMEGLLDFADRKAWRAWLRKNHSSVDVAWLKIYKKGKKGGISHVEAVEEALCFGWIDGQLKTHDDDGFALRFTQRKKDSIWSEINRDRAIRLIEKGAMTLAGLKKIEEAKRNGKWAAAYSSRRKQTVPPELKIALSRNKKALQAFMKMSNSHQLSYIYWINEGKREETRKRRIEATVKKMKERSSKIITCPSLLERSRFEGRTRDTDRIRSISPAHIPTHHRT
jgi:uncharacterized protein YdeI (YjbR/CyaY-like superfamily)